MSLGKTCRSRLEDCRCGLADDHPFEPHTCLVPGCLARWTGDPENFTLRVVTPPVWPIIPAPFRGRQLRAVSA